MKLKSKCLVLLVLLVTRSIFYFQLTFVSLVWAVCLLTLLTSLNWMIGCPVGNVWDGAAFCVQDGEMLA